MSDDEVQTNGIMMEDREGRKPLSLSALEENSVSSSNGGMKVAHGMSVSSESDLRVDDGKTKESGLESGFNGSKEESTKFDLASKEVTIEDEDSISQEKELPPFPWLPMAALCTGMLAHSVVFTNPLPYVAFMVVDFKMADNVDSAGYYAGWITGTFMIGRTMAGLTWGMASDRYGRKLCLLLSMMNVAIFGLLLGFSTSFTMAVSFRLAIGLGNGFMGVAKTCISEIFVKEHELKAFGILNGMWGLGLIVGPAVGGLLSRPAIQYPTIFSSTSIWGVFPYLLPCLVCAIIAVIAFIGIYFWLPETAGRSFDKLKLSGLRSVERKNGKSYPSVGFTALPNIGKEDLFCIVGDEDDDEDCFEVEGKLESGDAVKDSTIINVNASEIKSSQSNSKVSKYAVLSTVDEGDYEEVTTQKELSKKPQNFNEMVANKSIRSMGVLYTSLCFSVMFVDEAFPLWAVTSIQKHGLSWNSGQVGAVLATVGLALILFQFFLYETVINNCCVKTAAGTFFGLIVVSSVAIFIFPIATSLVSSSGPSISDDSGKMNAESWQRSVIHANNSASASGTVTGSGSNYESYSQDPYDMYIRQLFHRESSINSSISNHINMTNTSTSTMDGSNTVHSPLFGPVVTPWVIFITIAVSLTFYRVSATSAFTTLGIVVNESVDKDMRGTMNGFIMTCGSIGNALGPILGSILYASSVNLPSPLDGRIVFFIGAVMLIIIGIVGKNKVLT